tara:strand:+ start:435 stop:608 length:174 start_codon:yes stop_codon:yes gene_type:complete
MGLYGVLNAKRNGLGGAGSKNLVLILGMGPRGVGATQYPNIYNIFFFKMSLPKDISS